MSLELRWTEQAVNQLGTVAEHISLASPIYAEQVVERFVGGLRKGQNRMMCASTGQELQSLAPLPFYPNPCIRADAFGVAKQAFRRHYLAGRGA